jgi:hypothetical protein
MSIKRLVTGVACAAMLLGMMSTQADARRGHRRSSTWVPNGAWKAIEKYAQTKFHPQAKLFKTDTTKADSMHLRGTNGGRAWIVGAKAPQQRPIHGFMPYLPRQTYFLATRTKGHRWTVTPLAGMGGYKSTVDAKADNARVHVGVGLFTPKSVGHGVEVQNSSGMVNVRTGTELARKGRSVQSQTVYVKGATQQQRPGYISLGTQANLTAMVRPPAGSWCGTPVPKDIPVNFSQVFFATGAQAQR